MRCSQVAPKFQRTKGGILTDAVGDKSAHRRTHDGKRTDGPARTDICGPDSTAAHSLRHSLVLSFSQGLALARGKTSSAEMAGTDAAP